MENSHNDSSSVCKKIFCCFFPTSGKNSHSHQNQYSLPESKPTYLSEQENYKQNAEWNRSNLQPPAKEVSGERLHYAASDVERHVQNQAGRSSSDMNRAFSDYINRSKFKIRAMSNVGGDGSDGEIMSREDEVYGAENTADPNDVFVDYINRAKFKIRKTSSIGSNRMISFRK